MNKFGLDPQDWDLVDAIVVQPLKNAGNEVFVFGSRATGKHKKFSDLDLLVVPSSELPQYLISNIRSHLEESDLNVKVDIVLNDDLADSYRTNVEQQKIKL